MLTEFILIVVNIGLLIIGFLYLRVKINKQLNSERFLRDIEDEVNKLVLELNQTTDRNIGLVEDRIRSLKDLLSAADKRMGVMRREIDTREREKEVYTELGKRPKTQAMPVPELSRQGYLDIADREDEGVAEANPPTQAGGEAPVESEQVPIVRRRPQIRVSNDLFPKAPSLREEVIALYSSGISPQIIAKRLSKTVGEIDLIIALAQGSEG